MTKSTRSITKIVLSAVTLALMMMSAVLALAILTVKAQAESITYGGTFSYTDAWSFTLGITNETEYVTASIPFSGLNVSTDGTSAYVNATATAQGDWSISTTGPAPDGTTVSYIPSSGTVDGTLDAEVDGLYEQGTAFFWFWVAAPNQTQIPISVIVTPPPPGQPYYGGNTSVYNPLYFFSGDMLSQSPYQSTPPYQSPINTTTPLLAQTISYSQSVSLGSGPNTAQTKSGSITLTINSVEVSYPTYSLIISATQGGTTSPALGTYTEPDGANVRVTAIPLSGYQLDYWMLDGNNVGTSNPINVTMDSDHTLQAVFAATSSGNISILTISGTVKIETKGSNQYRPLVLSDIVGPGDTIMTGDDGGVTFSLPNGGGLIKLGPSSSFIVVGGSGTVSNFYLWLGKIWTNLFGGPNPFTVNTLNVAVIGVRGIEFAVTAYENGTTTVMALDGLVEVQDLASNSTVSLQANQTISVPNVPGGLSEQDLQSDVSSFNPASINQWWTNTVQEFQPYMLLPLLMITTLLVTIIRMKKKRNAKVTGGRLQANK
jgi:hypothetical protein